MRLIDADKLIEILEENISKLARDIKLEQRGMQLSIFVAQLCQTKHIIGVIDKQPTAYDVDKVVKHIEECNRMIEKDMEKKIDRELRMYYEGQLFIANEIIKLIKRGGIDD